MHVSWGISTQPSNSREKVACIHVAQTQIAASFRRNANAMLQSRLPTAPPQILRSSNGESDREWNGVRSCWSRRAMQRRVQPLIVAFCRAWMCGKSRSRTLTINANRLAFTIDDRFDVRRRWRPLLRGSRIQRRQSVRSDLARCRSHIEVQAPSVVRYAL